jgi:hypothetical protein
MYYKLQGIKVLTDTYLCNTRISHFLGQLLTVKIGDSTGQQVLKIETSGPSNAWHGISVINTY